MSAREQLLWTLADVADSRQDAYLTSRLRIIENSNSMHIDISMMLLVPPWQNSTGHDERMSTYHLVA